MNEIHCNGRYDAAWGVGKSDDGGHSMIWGLLN